MQSSPTSQTAKQMSLTETEVKQLVDNWYTRLDGHPPVTEILPMLAEEGLIMQLPETTLHGQADFLHWYEGIIHKFFNEVHTLKEVKIQLAAHQAEVQLIVNWQAQIWQAPAAKSQWIGFDATQRWHVERSHKSGLPIIVTYIVEKFLPMPGSSAL